MHPGLQALQTRLQHDFSDPSLLQRATTHRSFSADHNERLEFLGDSVLNLAVASLLYRQLSALPEGDLSRVRANLVKQDTLHQLALRLQLPGVLRLGEGETKSGGTQRPSILADALEALIGALYLDAGLPAAEDFVRRSWAPLVGEAAHPPQDPKTTLQEWAQGAGLPLPDYRTVASEGPPHSPVFSVEVQVEGHPPARGTGRSKRAAEQAAAAALLDAIGTAGRG